MVVTPSAFPQIWKPHFFVLTSHKLFFTTEVEDEELRKGDDEEEGTENGVRDICVYVHLYTHRGNCFHFPSPPPLQAHTRRQFSGRISNYLQVFLFILLKF